MAIRILIVEDEAVTALDLKHEIVGLGYDVIGIADDAADAVRLAGELKPDLVLMDVRLSGEMDGVIAASAIRGNDDIPVVFVTAHSDQATLERAIAAGPFGYILKPFHHRELKVTIEVALSKHAKEAEARALVSRLEGTLARVKLLSGVLPICAGCKRIRESNGRWIDIEEYIHRHSEADFTHGICPECTSRLYPELNDSVPVA